MTVEAGTSSISLRRNSFYSALGMLVRLGTTIVSIPILIRNIGLEQYGVWAVLLSVLGLSALAQFGLEAALAFYIAGAQTRDKREDKQQVLGTSLVLFSVLGSAVAVLISIGAGFLSRTLFPTMPSAREFTVSLVLIGLVSLVQFWKQWAVSVEAGLLRYDLQVRAESVGAILLYGGLILLAWQGYGLASLATWLLLATFSTLLIHLFLLYRVVHLRFEWRHLWSSAWAHVLLKFGIAQWISQIGGTLFGQADRILVNILLGPTAAGLYAAGTSIVSKINELSAVPIHAIVPAISMAKANGDTGRITHVFVRAQRLNSLIIYLIAATIILASTPLARIMVTPMHVDELAALLSIMALVYAFYSLNATGFFAAIGIGFPSINARWSLTAGTLFVILLVTLVPWYGLSGAASANIAYSLTLMINYQVVRKVGMDLGQYVLSLLPFLVCMLLCSIVGVLLTQLHVLPTARVIVSTSLIITSAAWIAGREWLDEINRTSRLLINRAFSTTHY